jgi:hypothetical protein
LIIPGLPEIHATASYLFWDPYLDHGWIPANRLKKGEHLKTPNGQSAVVVGGSTPAVHEGWMWDLTVPGNNDHDFYVVASGSTAILVHNVNCEDIRVSPMAPDWATKGAHVHIGGSEVRVFPNGAGGIGAEPIRLSSGTASASQVQDVLDCLATCAPLRQDLIAKAGAAMQEMNAGSWGYAQNRAAEMQFLIKALGRM